MQTPQALTCTGILIAIGKIFVFVPTSTQPAIEAAMTQYIHRASYFCQQGGVAITVACHHLTNAHALSITCQRGCARPAFKGHLLRGNRYRVKMIVEPDRVIALRFGLLGYACHCFIGLNRVSYAYQVHAPSLGHNYSILHCHRLAPSSSNASTIREVVGRER